MKFPFVGSVAAFSAFAVTLICAQGPGGPGGPGARKHTANTAQPLDLIPANKRTPERNKVKVRERGDELSIVSNGMPDHRVGAFPNRANPNSITEQSHDIVIPANPQPAPMMTFIHGDRGAPRVFGVTLDGVLIEPGTAEVWMGDRASGWNYEALGGAVPLGLDTNYGHVQPTGLYHYHGIPTGLMKRLGAKRDAHSPMIGWAADGFPIYALNGYSDPDDPNSEIVELKSGYRLKKGDRPAQPDAPGGVFDGSFVQDYEFIDKSGGLDECNGRFCVTAEFPDGTYAYFMTNDWPVIPRAFRGTPVQLKEEGPPGGGGGPGGPGGGKGPPPKGGPGMKGKGFPPKGGPPPRR